MVKPLMLPYDTFENNFEIKHQLETYCRTHNERFCLYIAYIACGSASLYVKMLHFFLTVLALSGAATITNIKIPYDAKIVCSTVAIWSILKTPLVEILILLFTSMDKTHHS